MTKLWTSMMLITLMLSLAFTALSATNADGTTVTYIGADTTTHGDWVGIYGNAAYVLCAIPDGSGNPDTIWGVPILDDVWKVDKPDPRALLTPDGNQRRATCYYKQPSPLGGEASFTVTLSNIPLGTYQLAMYFLDWDWPDLRDENVTVSVNGGTTVQVSDFHNGVYEVVDINVGEDGTITVTVSNNAGTGYPNPVLSGVFLDEATGLTQWVEDRTTQGNWIGNYGGLCYLLADMNHPNEIVGGTWTVTTDASRCAWTDFYSDIKFYPINRSHWTDFVDASYEDPTWDKYGLLTPDGSQRMAACWWSDMPYGNRYPGGLPVEQLPDQTENPVVERGNEMRINLTIPAGCWRLTFYFFDSSPYDNEPWRQQTAIIQTMDGGILGQITMGPGEPFTTGVYYSYYICTSEALPLTITIFNTMGDNAVISGIFLDEVAPVTPPSVPTGSISGIKFFDANKNGIYDNDDWPIAGWNITLLDEEGNVTAWTLTDEYGCYIFEGLEPGTYIVREVLPDGWTNTTAIEQTVELLGGGATTVTLEDGTEVLSGSVSVPLIAGQHYEVGSVDICFNGTHLFVTYTTTDDYYLTETQLYVGDEPPETSAPGQFPFKHEPIYTQTDQYIISLDYLELSEWPEVLYIAAHATVYCSSWPDNGAGTETAWAGVPPGEETAWASTSGWTPFGPGWGGCFPYAPATIVAESVTDVNFGNWAPIAKGPAGLTIGFWKTNIGKNLGYIQGKPQLTGEEIEVFLGAINKTYGEDYPFLHDLTLEEAYTILSIPDASNMTQKAEAQILGLLLTAQYKKYADEYVYLPDIGQGSYYSGDMSGAIDYILGLYDAGSYEAAKNLADALNNMPEEGYIWVELI